MQVKQETYNKFKDLLFLASPEVKERIEEKREPSEEGECRGCVFEIYALSKIKEVSLEDLLIALEKIDKRINIDWCSNWIAEKHIQILWAKGHPLINIECEWQLCIPASGQSEETIQGIINLLK